MIKKIILSTFCVVLYVGTVGAATKEAPKAPPVFVETFVVKEAPYSEEVSSTGTLLSIPGVIVKPEISGRVTKIYFNSGDLVEKDVVLIEINSDIMKAQLIEALASLKLNKLNFDRSSSLYKTKDISKSDFDKAEANYISAKAKAGSIRAQLKQTTISAPFSGKLGLSQVDVGDYINVGQNIVNLQTLDPLKVDFSVPEAYQSKVKVGQVAHLKSDAYPGKKFVGKVLAIESLIDPNSRTLKVRANVPNVGNKLIPGGFVEVVLQLSKKKAIMIPQTALVYDSAGNYVFKVVDNKAEKAIVVCGEKGKEDVVIKSGLKVGDTVVTAGQIKLHQGSQVMLVDSKSK